MNAIAQAALNWIDHTSWPMLAVEVVLGAALYVWVCCMIGRILRGLGGHDDGR